MKFDILKALRAVRRAIVESGCSIDNLSWKLFARNLNDFKAFCRQGASFGMLFGFLFEPLESFLEQFWSIGVIFERLCRHFLVAKKRCVAKGAPRGP